MNSKYTFSEPVTLVKIRYVKDEYLNELEKREEKEVLADIRSISQNEYYSASRIGYKPSIKAVINDVDYEGEEEIIYNNLNYKVIRTFINGEIVELTAEVAK